MTEPDQPTGEQRRAVIAGKRSGIFDRTKLAEATGESMVVVEQVVGPAKDRSPNRLPGRARKLGETTVARSAWLK
jgi:hypothetical protein